MLLSIGIKSVAIMSNDQETYIEDSTDRLKKQSSDNNFNFPYLIDFDQSTAKKFQALCTPEFFGFNSDKSLQYRGRLDSFGKDKNLGKRELFYAMNEISEKKYTNNDQFPSMGCSIKWKY